MIMINLTPIALFKRPPADTRILQLMPAPDGLLGAAGYQAAALIALALCQGLDGATRVLGVDRAGRLFILPEVE